MKGSNPVAWVFAVTVTLLATSAVVTAGHGRQYNASGTAWVNGHQWGDGACDGQTGLCTYLYYCRVAGGGNALLGGALGCRNGFDSPPQFQCHYDGPIAQPNGNSCNVYLGIDYCYAGELENMFFEIVAVHQPTTSAPPLVEDNAEKALHSLYYICGENLRPVAPS